MKKTRFYKLFLVATFLRVALASCTKYNAKMVNTNYPPIHTKIPNVNHETKANCIIAEIDLVLIKKTINNELTTNIISTGNSPEGFIEIVIDNYELDTKQWLTYFSLVTLGCFNLIGCPLSYIGIDMRLKFNIYDNSHNLIKDYSYNVTDRSLIGYYYGRDGAVVLIDVTKKALSNFRKDIERDAQFITEKLNENIQRPNDTDFEQTIIRWDVQSRPQGADVFWRVVSKTPEVKSTNNKYLQTTPYEATKSLGLKGVTYENSGNVCIILRCEKEGYLPQEKEYNVRMILDQEEISALFRLVKEGE